MHVYTHFNIQGVYPTIYILSAVYITDMTIMIRQVIARIYCESPHCIIIDMQENKISEGFLACTMMYIHGFGAKFNFQRVVLYIQQRTC